MSNIIIKRTDHVDTMHYSGPIGVVLLSAGLPKVDEYVLNFHEDMGEARLDTIENESTGDVVWDGNDGEEWTAKDDLILEACEAIIYQTL